MIEKERLQLVNSLTRISEMKIQLIIFSLKFHVRVIHLRCKFTTNIKKQ